MKKMICSILGLTLISFGIFGINAPKPLEAEVNIEVNLGPPVILVDEPSDIIFVRGLGVYYVPDSESEIFFYGGYWWSRRGMHWYHSTHYRTGWVIVRERNVPGPIFRIPRDYRVRYVKERRIHYREWKEYRDRPENGPGNARKNEKVPGMREKGDLGDNKAATEHSKE